jgi:hypothetical protein
MVNPIAHVTARMAAEIFMLLPVVCIIRP